MNGSASHPGPRRETGRHDATDPAAPSCATMGIGSLPHRSLAEAAEFAWTATDVPTLPSLPRRSAAEGMIAQALVGVPGVRMGPYGSIAVDVVPPGRHAPEAPDLDDDAFGGFRAALRAADGTRRDAGIVKWQVTGPVTLAFALMRAGLAPSEALEFASEAVRAHVTSIGGRVRGTLPGAVQYVVLDEPSLGAALESPDLAVDAVLDAVSGALARVDSPDVAGVHCCAEVDLSMLLATGPSLISVPVAPAARSGRSSGSAARLAEHIDNGGLVAWGVVRTDGPVPAGSDGPLRGLLRAWSEVVSAGADGETLHARSLLTPACGLGMHAVSVARRITDLVAEVSARCADRDGVLGSSTGPIA